MAIFAGAPGFQGPTAVGTSAVAVWTANSSALAALSPAVTLNDVMVQNNGPSTIYVGQSGVTSTTGLPVKAGKSVVLPGFTATSGTTANDVYAICASGGSAVVEAGLATTDIVV